MKSLIASLCMLACCLPCAAQSSVVGGVIEGRVLDASGAAIAGATVQITQSATHVVRQTTADSRGVFRAGDLAVGTYSLSVRHPGFASYTRSGLVLELGADLRLTVPLQPASLRSEVTVTGTPPGLDLSQTSLVSRVDRERIEELPVHSRNALDFALIEPGVSAAPAAPAGSPHAALPSSGFSVGGVRPRSNSISIDGLDNNDEFTGASRTELSPEIVQEYQVVNNGLSAQYGGASGGSINVVTRSGGDIVHGDAFVFWQDSAFNARDPFAAQSRKPPFRRARVGFAIGGPLRKNRIFYYTALEQEHNRGETGDDLDPAAVATIDAGLAAGAFPGLPVRQLATGLVPIARAETELSGKLDDQLGPRRSLMLRYALTNNRLAGSAFNTGGLFDPSGFGNSFVADQSLAGALVTTHGADAVGDLRFQAATRRVTLATNQAAGPEIAIAGLLTFGRPYAGNGYRRENHWQATYTYLRSAGPHLWTFGATVNHVHEHALMRDGFGGLYRFATLADFFAANPDSFRQSFGAPGAAYGATAYGVFVQDHWTLTPRLTADAGLRYDFESLPSPFAADADNFSPRLGLAFSPAPLWILRAGYGIFYDRYILANLNRALVFNGATGSQQVAEGPLAAAIFRSTLGAPLAAPWPGLAPSIFRPDPHLATPYSQHLSVGVERWLGHDTSVAADYLFVHGVKLPRTRNVNLAPLAGAAAFGPARLDPAFGAVYQLENAASASYNGLTLTFNRRMADDFEWLATYTWAKTLDDASSFDEQPQDPYNLRAERGYSLQDQRRRFAFDALWDLPIGPDEDSGPQPVHGWFENTFDHIEIAPILWIAGGTPVNPLVGVDANRSLAFPLAARPPGFGRNTLRLPASANLDLRVLKYFPRGEFAHLDVVAEAFNLFNHPNVAALNPDFGLGPSPLPSFGAAIADFGARVVEFSLDYEY